MTRIMVLTDDIPGHSSASIESIGSVDKGEANLGGNTQIPGICKSVGLKIGAFSIITSPGHERRKPAQTIKPIE